MQVTPEQRIAYKSDSVHKTLRIYFPNLQLNIGNDQIYQESMSLKESVLEKESIEFVGCIASTFSINLYGVASKIKGQPIEVYIKTDDTDEIPLFKGIIDTAKKETGKNYVKVTAYDILYTKGTVDVSNWYNGLKFPITIKDFRVSLFKYLSLPFDDTTELVNDDIKIAKQYNPSSLQSLNVIKAICQVNGCFGIVNRQGVFEFRYLKQTYNAVYPSIKLYPSLSIHPNAIEQSPYTNAEILGYYKQVEYNDFVVHPVDKVTIRQTNQVVGTSYGVGENNYIIQGNMFTYNLDTKVLAVIAERIHSKVSHISYIPFESDTNGLPFAECGVDAITFYYTPPMTDTGIGGRMAGSASGFNTLSASQNNQESMNFYVLNRELKGVQALRDTYSAQGEEYQNEFITDLNTSIDTIQQDYSGKFDEIDDRLDGLESGLDTNFEAIDNEFGNVWDAIEEGGNFQIQSVTSIPSNPLTNTLYLIQGEIIIIR